MRKRTAYVARMGFKGDGKFEGHGVDVEVVGRKSREDEGCVFVIDEGGLNSKGRKRTFPGMAAAGCSYWASHMFSGEQATMANYLVTSDLKRRVTTTVRVANPAHRYEIVIADRLAFD